MPLKFKLITKEEITELRYGGMFGLFSYLIINGISVGFSGYITTIGGIFLINAIGLVIYSILLYIALIVAHKSGKTYNKYNLGLVYFAVFFILSFGISSIIAKRLVFPRIGILAVLLAFIIPALFHFQKKSTLRIAH